MLRRSFLQAEHPSVVGVATLVSTSKALSVTRTTDYAELIASIKLLAMTSPDLERTLSLDQNGNGHALASDKKAQGPFRPLQDAIAHLDGKIRESAATRLAGAGADVQSCQAMRVLPCSTGPRRRPSSSTSDFRWSIAASVGRTRGGQQEGRRRWQVGFFGLDLLSRASRP